MELFNGDVAWLLWQTVSARLVIVAAALVKSIRKRLNDTTTIIAAKWIPLPLLVYSTVAKTAQDWL